MIRQMKFIMCIVFLVSFVAYGKNDVRFELITPEKVYPDREFTIIFRLKNAEGQDFRAPEFKNCQVVKGPGVSRSSQYLMDRGVGGFFNYTDYTYILKTDQRKKIKIGSASVRVNGKLIKSASHDILLDRGVEQSSSDRITFSGIVPEKVEVGEAFKIVYVLKNARGENFNLPIVQDCEFLYGPEVSLNGGFSFWGLTPVETSYILVMRAKKIGIIKIPSATINVNGKVLKTKKMKVKILPESEKTREKKFNAAQRKYQSI
ncbi:BatD family protein [Coprobacter sp.]